MEKKNPTIFFETLEDENILESSGISKKNLNGVSIILQHPIEDIFEFLVIFKQDISQRFSSILFNKYQSSISKNIHKIINLFDKSFVNDNIG